MLAEGPQPDDTIGGRYRIVRALGSGGMGDVYEAANVFTDKRVALKLLRRDVSDRSPKREQAAEDRLLREARAGSRIKHRHVVDIYDIGFDEGAMFLVMELLSGETLAAFLERETVTVPALLSLLLPAMRGVAEAHRQGVIHRDIKPENIFLSREVDQALPVPMVLDFGVAKLEDTQLLTRSGHAVGTPLFMSLEQLQGARDLDARADVYGFGVILYMALTGRAPHVARSLPELALKVATSDALPPHALRGELPSGLSQAVARALARARDDRTPNMERLIADLTPYASESAYLTFTRKVDHTRIVQSSLLSALSSTEAGGVEDFKTRALTSAHHPQAEPDEQGPQPQPSMATPPPPKPGSSQSMRWMVGATLGGVLIAGIAWQLVSRPDTPSARTEQAVPPSDTTPAERIAVPAAGPSSPARDSAPQPSSALSRVATSPDAGHDLSSSTQPASLVVAPPAEQARSERLRSPRPVVPSARGPRKNKPVLSAPSDPSTIGPAATTATTSDRASQTTPTSKSAPRSTEPGPQPDTPPRGISVDEFFR